MKKRVLLAVAGVKGVAGGGHFTTLKKTPRWLSGAVLLGKLSMPMRPTDSDNSKERAYCLALDLGCLDIFLSSIFPFLFLSPSRDIPL